MTRPGIWREHQRGIEVDHIGLVIDRAVIVFSSPVAGRVVLRLVTVVVGMVVPAGIWSRSCRLMQRRTVVGMAAKVNMRLRCLIDRAGQRRLWQGKPSQEQLKKHRRREHQPYRRCCPVPQTGCFCFGGPLICHRETALRTADSR